LNNPSKALAALGHMDKMKYLGGEWKKL
jgi:hypothetical protein